MPPYRGNLTTVLDPNGVPSHPGLQVVRDSVGNFFPLDSAALTYGYTGTNITSITAACAEGTFVKTIAYNVDAITSESAWVRQ